MLDGVGPASYAMRSELPDRTVEGEKRIQPLRALPEYYLEPRDPDPRGLTVVGADGVTGGEIVDVWIDRADPQVRYFEIALAPGAPAGMSPGDEAPPRRTLVPVNFAHIDRSGGRVVVKAVLGEHFGRAPTLADPDQVTLREEDRISAYFGSGLLYATSERAEPLV
jgi:photosynthetic reaction center H subunit